MKTVWRSFAVMRCFVEPVNRDLVESGVEPAACREMGSAGL